MSQKEPIQKQSIPPMNTKSSTGDVKPASESVFLPELICS